MPELVVNVDVYAWEEPASDPRLPPTYRSARRGETVSVSDDEAKRGQAIQVARHYPSPDPGAPGTIARLEAALVDPADQADALAAATSEAARIAELEAEVRELRARQAPAPGATPLGAVSAASGGVALPPSVTGVRLPPNSDVPVVGVSGAAALGSTSTVDGEQVDLSSATVEQVVAYLGQNPGDVERISALEESRARPRSGVLEQVERVRQAQVDAAAGA